MNDDYLWDRSGAPDADVERLEQLLAPLRLGGAPAAPAPVPAPRRSPWPAVAAVAAVVLVAVSIPRSPATVPGAATGWAVTRVDGSARLGDSAAKAEMPVRSGEAVRTAGASELHLEDDDVGRIELGPNSDMRASGSRLELRRGQLHAYIWAPPRRFVVDTPSAQAIDLGCEYTLDVDPAGNGLLRVALGWVAFQFQGRESFIPAGARCATKKRLGPGVPYYEDAPAALAEAVAGFDRGDATAVPMILSTARDRDALTLWHLLTRVAPNDRGAVFDRFAQLVSLPPEVTRAGVIAGEPPMIDRCWDALGLENTEWWRGWERPWTK